MKSAKTTYHSIDDVVALVEYRKQRCRQAPRRHVQEDQDEGDPKDLA